MTTSTNDRIALDVLEGNIQLLAEKERLEAEKRRLEEVDRLKSEFLARVSHDLRTPLNSIIGFSELMLTDGTRLTRKQQDCIQAILRNGQSLLTQINDLLDLASIDAGRIVLRREQVPLATLVEDLRAATEPTLVQRRLEAHWPSPAEIAGKTAFVDRRRWGQCLLNLVDNARKFTPAGGSVTVTMDANAVESEFTVADTGQGIPENEREAVFRAFYQRSNPTVQAGSGVGLGLAIVRGVVDLHGGRIELESRVGRGTRFRVVVPQA